MTRFHGSLEPTWFRVPSTVTVVQMPETLAANTPPHYAMPAHKRRDSAAVDWIDSAEEQMLVHEGHPPHLLGRLFLMFVSFLLLPFRVPRMIRDYRFNAGIERGQWGALERWAGEGSVVAELLILVFQRAIREEHKGLQISLIPQTEAPGSPLSDVRAELITAQNSTVQTVPPPIHLGAALIYRFQRMAARPFPTGVLKTEEYRFTLTHGDYPGKTLDVKVNTFTYADGVGVLKAVWA